MSERGFDCRSPVIVPDEEEQIKAFIKSHSDKGDIDWIVTTGGTGFGVRDKTPEVIIPDELRKCSILSIMYLLQVVSNLIEREAPGLVHLMISTSLKHTPLAALSRPVAGTVGNTLVVTLPGSVKAVKENLEALISGGVVNHAIDLIKGGTGKRVHTELASSGTSAFAAASTNSQNSHEHHGHHHHHHVHDVPLPRTNLSHDLSQPSEPNYGSGSRDLSCSRRSTVSARHRVSPYELVSFETAMDSILEQVLPLRTVQQAVSSFHYENRLRPMRSWHPGNTGIERSCPSRGRSRTTECPEYSDN